ncbi:MULTISPECIES: D-cysteine desulfhydrase family protein [unclassified Anaeromyxobacter]|uniref:D-cysteine desulfhydrase family protein n=1 Tax=unclassified Anaeromyxobacter TaxID=2620896 RepID=UPI001F5AD184|nr:MULTISPECIES: D-cysteine desulfhydrase family protein [unclassified Anaeromyxobacter]
MTPPTPPTVHLAPRVVLARLPTPLERSPRLGAELGLDLLYKRDDLTGLELSGNKARKLEFLIAEAEAARADTLVTCGGVQSNHCRATAFAAARRGLAAVLLLRVPDPSRPPALEANALLDRLAGAELRWVSHDEYRRRAEVMEAVAAELRAAGRRPYVIPEGGSSALGSLGYVAAVAELRAQLPEAWRTGPVTIAYAAGSGGTGAGLELGVRVAGWREARPLGFAVCNDAAYFRAAIAGLCADARRRWPELPGVPEDEIAVDDGFIGPGYAQATDEGLQVIRRAARVDGVLLDPVYTAKAMLGVARRASEPGGLPASRVVFLHTGGAFGLFPFAERLGTTG